jgi:muramidase (phage lysozyme)
VTPNIAAFLTMISVSEGTYGAADPYRVCYAYKHTVADLNYHPAQPRPPAGLREWHGEPLDNLGAAYAGKVSTAAGRYQINLPSWLDGAQALKLADFTGPSQDDWTIWKIKSKGALDLVNAGRIAEALATPLHEVWASLPGPNIGQPQRNVAFLLNAYSAAGGAYA